MDVFIAQRILFYFHFLKLFRELLFSNIPNVKCLSSFLDFFGLTKIAQGACPVYGAASGPARADGIRCSSCSQTWTRFQRGECFQFNYTLTAGRRLKLALKGNSAPEFNVKQRENE